MSGRFARGWSMARESFAVLRQYPRLAILPMISGAIFLLATGAIVASLLPQFPSLYATTGPIWDRLGETDSAQLEVYLAAAVVFYVIGGHRDLLQCRADPLRAARPSPDRSRPCATASPPRWPACRRSWAGRSSPSPSA